MKNVDIKCLEVGLIHTNCYIVHYPNNQVMVIDPGDQASLIISKIKSLDFVLLTHEHFDHLLGLKELLSAFPNAKLALSSKAMYDSAYLLRLLEALRLGGHFGHLVKDLPKPSILLNDLDKIGPFTVLHTPGHSKGSICLLDEEDKILFTGDTLFDMGYGRVDLEGSSEQDMFKSLFRLSKLDKTLTVYPGHGDSTTLDKAISFVL